MSEATNTILGEIKLVGDLAGDGGAQLGTNPQLATISGLTPGQYDIANITVDSKGRVVAVDSATSQQVSALIPDASTTVKGKVKVGTNLFINGSPTNGYTTADFGGLLITTTPTGLCPTATYTLELLIDTNIRTFSAVGSNLETTQEVITALNAQLGTYATATLSGGNIKITSLTTGSTSIVDITVDGLFACMSGYVSLIKVDGIAACELYAKTASLTDAGVVQTGSGITNNNGLISVDLNALPVATTTTSGVTIVPTSGNLTVDGSGNIGVPTGTSSILGVVKSGTGTSIDETGSLNLDLSTVVATTTALGAIIVPTSGNLTVDGSGNIGVPKGTSSILGVVKSGTGTSIDETGSLNVPIATTSSLGVVKVGSGLSVDVNGVLTNPSSSIPDATYVSKGVIQVDSTYLSVNAGILTAKQATTSSLGVLKVGSVGYLDVIGGVLSLTSLVARTNIAQTYTRAQVVSSTNLSGSSVTPNLNLSNMFYWTLSANSTINNPTNNTAGGTYIFAIYQDATGSRTLSYGSNYKFPGGAPLLSTAPNSLDIISCVSDGTNLYCTINKGF